MNIVVVTRCLNGKEYIDRFAKGYSFAEKIIVSDGGSTDGSLDAFKKHPKIQVVNFEVQKIINGYIWNPDNLHIQHAIDEGLKCDPDWLILDDLDDVPNQQLNIHARTILRFCKHPQVNAFRLYMWGDDFYFPKMNNYFDENYTSIWAWNPRYVTIETDKSKEHGTLTGIQSVNSQLLPPYCLLHKSWHPDTIQAKVDRYNSIGLPMNHPLEHPEAYGLPEPLPEWAVE